MKLRLASAYNGQPSGQVIDVSESEGRTLLGEMRAVRLWDTAQSSAEAMREALKPEPEHKAILGPLFKKRNRK